MNSLPIQLLAIACTVVLALPPGWCSGLECRDGGVPAPAKAACCQQGGDQAPESKQPSVPLGDECCCQWDATVPQKPVDSADAAAHAAPLFHLSTELSGQPRCQAASALFLPAGPRLHVLQCVWRC